MTRYLGGFAVASYVVITAAQGVVLGSLVQKSVWDAITLMVVTFLVVSAFFNFLQIRRPRQYITRLRGSPLEVLRLNVLSAVNFASYYLAIRTVPISAHAAIALGVGPLVVLILERRNNSRSHVGEAISFVGLVASLGFIAATLVERVALFDLTMSFVCGISLVLTLYSVRRLTSVGWSADEVMASRFFGLIMFGLVEVRSLVLPNIATQTAALQVGLLAMVGVVVPVYLLTWGQGRTSPFTSTMLLYCMPILMAFGEAIEGRVSSAPSLALATTSIFLAVGFLAKMEKPNG